jgi:hypothetical protein
MHITTQVQEKVRKKNAMQVIPIENVEMPIAMEGQDIDYVPYMLVPTV